MATEGVRVARAFAPGHVTGVFRPAIRARDPRARGSLGAGIVLELGATAEARFAPGKGHRVRILGDRVRPWPISEDVARRLAPSEPGAVTVRLRHDLPVGQGFGMSAAGALATALAVGELAGAPRRRAIDVAHLADLFGGGGLGGVPAILGGGLEVRVRPGVPPYGRVVRQAFPGRMLVGVVGRPIPSPKVLRSPKALARIEAASGVLSKLARVPAADAFFRASERFTDEAGLLTPAVARTVEALRDRGAFAAQAMFGQSFFALPRTRSARAECVDWLRKRGVRAVEIGAAASGGGLLRAGTS